jgi:hypothetical protein
MKSRVRRYMKLVVEESMLLSWVGVGGELVDWALIRGGQGLGVGLVRWMGVARGKTGV